jgi:L-serine dehydratase
MNEQPLALRKPTANFMQTSLFDLFKIGIGPSSSHTVGPMRAAYQFAQRLAKTGLLSKVARVRVELYGSLALTGLGHGTDRGILLGLAGEQADHVNPLEIEARIRTIKEKEELRLFGVQKISFQSEDLVFRNDAVLPGHSNGMRFTALGMEGQALDARVFYSIGGGFIIEEGEDPTAQRRAAVGYPFHSSAELLHIGQEHHLPIHLIVLTNEMSWRGVKEIRAGIRRIWEVMQECTCLGLCTQGELPGALHVRRRAADLAARLRTEKRDDPLSGMDWLNAWAIAVNEENAAGGRVVTAPTNGAAGIIPAVAHYYTRFLEGGDEGITRYFLGATAIGVLYKETASISGAEVGCQGRWESLVPWRPEGWCRRSAEPMNKSNTPPKLPWNTISE